MPSLFKICQEILNISIYCYGECVRTAARWRKWCGCLLWMRSAPIGSGSIPVRVVRFLFGDSHTGLGSCACVGSVRAVLLLAGASDPSRGPGLSDPGGQSRPGGGGMTPYWKLYGS